MKRALRSRQDALVDRTLVPAFYFLMTRLMALVLRLFGVWDVRGLEHVPGTGPLIVVANHLNLADPPLLGASIPRRIRFMAKQELFAGRFGGTCIRLFGAFPVRRAEADLHALRTARRLLQQGEVVGMFPEGHRSGGAGLLPAHPGTALLALRSGAPVLPVGITGSERIRSLHVLLERPAITVTIGEPLTLAAAGRLNAENLEAATTRIMQAVAELLPASYRGVYTQTEVS